VFPKCFHISVSISFAGILHVSNLFIVKQTHGTPRECGRISPSPFDNWI
jgi:hypothetical protein